MGAPNVLSPEEVARLEAKIAAAESRTSAQLKVAIAGSSWLGLKRRARKVFEQHGLAQTGQRNCVLVLVVPKNRELLIYGDEAIHQAVGQSYWDDVRERISAELAQGRYYDGLSLGVTLLGEKLASLFPPQGVEKNEISNQLLFVA